jgi:hypothetical protein
LFVTSKDSSFWPDLERVEKEVASAGVTPEILNQSLDFMREVGLVSFKRGPFGGAVQELVVRPSAVDTCCEELVPGYPEKKRSILAATVNEGMGTSSDRLAEGTGEERWLACHVLRWAEERGLVRTHPVYVGHDFLRVDWVSPGLKRKLHES